MSAEYDRVSAYYSTKRGRMTRCLSSARGRARKKGLPFALTRYWLEERFDRCSVTGIEFEYSVKSPFLPSIDRIDISGGYTPENCRVVCWIYNCARGTFRDEDVLRLAVALLRNGGVNSGTGEGGSEER